MIFHCLSCANGLGSVEINAHAIDQHNDGYDGEGTCGDEGCACGLRTEVEEGRGYGADVDAEFELIAGDVVSERCKHKDVEGVKGK